MLRFVGKERCFERYLCKRWKMWMYAKMLQNREEEGGNDGFGSVNVADE